MLNIIPLPYFVIYWTHSNKPLTCVWWWLLVLHCIDAHHRDAALWWLPLWGLVGLDWIDISCPCGTHRFRRPFIYTSLKYRTSGLNLHELIVLEISRPYIYNGNWEKIHIHLFPIRRLRNIQRNFYLFILVSFKILKYPLFCTLVPIISWYHLYLDTDLNNLLKGKTIFLLSQWLM